MILPREVVLIKACPGILSHLRWSFLRQQLKFVTNAGNKSILDAKKLLDVPKLPHHDSSFCKKTKNKKEKKTRSL